jgi:hypothetical protein
MRFARRDKRKPQHPPAPRMDATNDRAEQLLYEQAFNEALWRRPTPL